MLQESNNNQNSQLFTELTAEQASAIAGGATLILHKVTAIRAREDVNWARGNGDDLYLKVNGSKVFGTVDDVDSGETVNINKNISFNGTANLQLFDDDPWYDPSGDDLIGSLSVGATPTGGQRTVRVGAPWYNPLKSAYDVTYSVV